MLQVREITMFLLFCKTLSGEFFSDEDVENFFE